MAPLSGAYSFIFTIFSFNFNSAGFSSSGTYFSFVSVSVYPYSFFFNDSRAFTSNFSSRTSVASSTALSNSGFDSRHP